MERGGAAALACTIRSSSSPSPVSHWRPLLRSRIRPSATARAPHFLLPTTGRRCCYYSQKRFLHTSKGVKRFSLTTSSPFGRPGVSLNDEDLMKDKLLIDCGEDQDCVLDGIVALGKFDALHIGHRELAMHASKSGIPFVLSFVGMAKVLGWEYRPPIVAQCDRKRVLSSWATYCRNVVPLEYQVEFSKVKTTDLAIKHLAMQLS